MWNRGSGAITSPCGNADGHDATSSDGDDGASNEPD